MTTTETAAERIARLRTYGLGGVRSDDGRWLLRVAEAALRYRNCMAEVMDGVAAHEALKSALDGEERG